jgi:hypothetical protein
MNAEQARRWVEAHRAAEVRQRQADADVLSPTASIAASLSLIALAADLGQTPDSPEGADRQDDEAVWAQWHRLRTRSGFAR